MIKTRRLYQWTVAAAGVTGMMLGATGAFAAGSVNWTSPADGSSFLTGTVVHPEGRAQGFDVGGTGLDLMLVLDASGSMVFPSQAVDGKFLQEWQQDAANALVNSLPSSDTSVGVVRYATSASLTLGLTATPDPAIGAAIDGTPATGTTNTAAGIATATAELNGANGTPGRSRQMVVISDGQSNNSTQTLNAAAAASAAGIIVHAVSLPGAPITEMQGIASNGGGVFVDFSEPSDLSTIEDFFSGLTGSFVGVDSVNITLPDGTVLTDVAVDGFGNFKVPNPGYALDLGDNVFTATAFFADGTEASSNLTLIGTAPDGVIPLPAAAWLLLGGLGGLGLLGRARRKG